MKYQNLADEPSNQDPRLITISLSNPSGFSQNKCSITLTIKNVPDPPVISWIANYTVNFIEDSLIPVLIFNDDRLVVTDEDNSFLAQATVNLTNQPMNVDDILIIPFNSGFNVSDNETNQLIITALADQLPHQLFLNYIQQISFLSFDQAPQYVCSNKTLYTSLVFLFLLHY